MNRSGNGTHPNSTGLPIVGNNTADFHLPYFDEPQWLEVLRLTIEVLLAFLGVIGNVVVCLVITLQPQMHTVANYFIRNLAVADLGILLVSFPLAVIKEQDPYNWPLGENFCRYVFPLSDVFYGVSVWSITLIAIDRYRAIVRGVPPKRGSAVFNSARWMVAGIWLLSFLIISVPMYFVVEFIDYRPVFDGVDCTPKWPDSEGHDVMRQAYLIGLTVFWYILPITIISATYQGISRKLNASTKFNRAISQGLGASEEQGTRRRIRERQNSRAKKILTPVVIVFALTMLPLNVFRIVVLYYEEIALHKFLWVYYNLCVLFVIANSSANFLIYSLVSDEFRQSFKRFFSPSRGRPSSATEKTLRSPLSHSPLVLSPLSGNQAERETEGKRNNNKESQM